MSVDERVPGEHLDVSAIGATVRIAFAPEVSEDVRARVSDAWSGVIQDTASTSTLVALICARERASAYSLTKGGIQSVASPLVSSRTHCGRGPT